VANPGPQLKKSLSTYKVVSAVADVEVGNCFDALNAWDRGILSVGVYQWTIGNLDNKTDPTIRKGELGGAHRGVMVRVPGGLSTIRKLGARSSLHVAESASRYRKRSANFFKNVAGNHRYLVSANQSL